MSLKALVAYEGSEGFDLHFSMNGADEFYLESYLQDYLDGEYDKTLSGVNPRLPGGSHNDTAGFTSSHDQAISGDPIAKDVSLDNIGNYIDFIDIEGLYIVQNDSIETYACVWIYPDILRILNKSVKLSVYDRNSFSLDRDKPLSDSPNLISRISGTDFSHHGFELPELRQFIEEKHQAICQNLRWETEDVYNKQELDSTWLVAEEVTKIRPQTTSPDLPPQKGSGVFVRVDTSVEPVSIYSRKSVAEVGQSLRIGQSLSLLLGSDSVSDTHRLTAELEILAELIRIFGSRVASFSPAPYDEYVSQYSKKMGVDTTCVGLDYRVVENGSTSVRLVEHEPQDVSSTQNLQGLKQKSIVPRRVLDIPKQNLGESSEAVLDRSVPGDLLTASITDDVITGIEFKHHSPLVTAEADILPEPIDLQASKGDARRKATGPRVAGKRFVLQSEYEVLDRELTDVGECVIIYDNENSVWKQFQSGEVLGSIIAGFTELEADPVEFIVINPPSVDYWYACIFGSYRCGMARQLRSKLNRPYRSIVAFLKT